MSTAGYTPLECLLLFQSLASYGTDDKSFTRISALLTNNALVKEAESYDKERLTSDALREFYSQLLRDELNGEKESSQDGTQPGSRKRKVQSPALKEAPDTQEQIHALVDRLYARYRDHMLWAIREDERRIAELAKDLSEIERGEWDERIRQENRDFASKNGAPPPPPVGSRSQSNGARIPSPEKGAVGQGSGLNPLPTKGPPNTLPTTTSRKDLQPDGQALGDIRQQQTTNSVSSPKVEQRPRPELQPPITHPRPPSTGLLQSPLQHGLHHPGIPLQWEPPYQAGPSQQPPYPHGPHYPQYNQQHLPPNYAAPPRGSFPHPHGPAPPSHPSVPSSPRDGQHPHHIHLPPPNTAMSPTSPGMALEALAVAAGQQYRAPSASNSPLQSPGQHANYPQPYPSQHRPPSGNGPAQQWNQQYGPPYQGSPHQNYATPNTRSPYPRPDLMPPESRQYNSPYNGQQTRPHVPLPSQHPLSRPSLPSTPVLHSTPRLTTGSGTKWTPIPSASTPRAFTYKDSPAVEPLSPVLQASKPATAKRVPKRGATKSDASQAKVGTKRGSQRTRAGSTPSVVTGSHRSASVTDDLSIDNHIKEEVATPMTFEETGDTTADETSMPPTRSMRRPRASHGHASPGRKRKREESVTETRREPKPLPTHVLWMRGFPKTCGPTLENIAALKTASMFKAPIKDRDADGYSNIIFRPQDLKSIKAAISAGSRHAVEIEKSLPEDEQPKAEGGVWLPISEDIIPPKGIVNYGQLKKELYRMFANAIMFNPDPLRGFGEKLRGNQASPGKATFMIDEGAIVKDTKEMIPEVEEIIDGLRHAEYVASMGTPALGRGSSIVRGSSVARGSSVRDSSVMHTDADEDDDADDADELAGDGEARGTASIKRRRRG